MEQQTKERAMSDDATAFQRGGETHFEILHMDASNGPASWVGFQHAQARMPGGDRAIPMKLIHRHADDKAELA